MTVKSFIVQAPGVDLVKLFYSKFTSTFCKLDHFINLSNIYDILMKSSSLQNRVIKFTAKKFYEIDPSIITTQPIQSGSLHII
jgi:hypothetical protein